MITHRYPPAVVEALTNLMFAMGRHRRAAMFRMTPDDATAALDAAFAAWPVLGTGRFIILPLPKD